MHTTFVFPVLEFLKNTLINGHFISDFYLNEPFLASVRVFQAAMIMYYTLYYILAQKCNIKRKYLNNEKTLIIIQNSRHTLFDTQQGN